MVLEVGDDDITAVTGVGDDGDDEEVAGGRGDVVASGAPSFLDHELVKFIEVHAAILVFVDVIDDLLHLLVSHLHLGLDLIQDVAQVLVRNEAFPLVVKDAEHLLVARLLVLLVQEVAHLRKELVEKIHVFLSFWELFTHAGGRGTGRSKTGAGQVQGDQL